MYISFFSFTDSFGFKALSFLALNLTTWILPSSWTFEISLLPCSLSPSLLELWSVCRSAPSLYTQGRWAQVHSISCLLGLQSGGRQSGQRTEAQTQHKHTTSNNYMLEKAMLAVKSNCPQVDKWPKAVHEIGIMFNVVEWEVRKISFNIYLWSSIFVFNLCQFS